MYDIVIIGGGASGLMAAAVAIEQAPDAQILLLEASDKVGRSILRSGNGRCNFSNASIDPACYHASGEIAPVLAALDNDIFDSSVGNPVVTFFERHGMLWRSESEGRLYPLTNKASTVLDVIMAPLRQHAVPLRCETKIERIECPQSKGAPFTLCLDTGELVRAHTVLVGVGGKGAPDGVAQYIPFSEPKPILGPLRASPRRAKPLDGIRVRGTAILKRAGCEIARESGEVLFRKYGLSGIAIFNLSRFMEPQDVIELDLMAAQGEDIKIQATLNRLSDDLRAVYGKELTLDELLRGVALPLVAKEVLRSCNLEGAQGATSERIDMLSHALTAFPFVCEGIGDPALCQVHRGGFALSAFHPDTLEAYAVPGLFVMGEALDVDGPCGGFNLHWAFLTGMLAGAQAAKMVSGGALC